MAMERVADRIGEFPGMHRLIMRQHVLAKPRK